MFLLPFSVSCVSHIYVTVAAIAEVGWWWRQPWRWDSGGGGGGSGNMVIEVDDQLLNCINYYLIELIIA